MAHNEDFTQIWAEPGDGMNFQADVARILGRSTGDCGQLCADVRWDDTQQDWVRLSTINKWAKYKPINQPGIYRRLTDNEFKGSYNEQSNGIYYGLRISGTPITSVTDTWPLMHNATYEYLPVSAPYRILDFSSINTVPSGWSHKLGYDKNAQPNPSGVLNSHVGIITGLLDNISAGYYDTNLTGVDLAEILHDSTWDKESALALTYPCILVSDMGAHGTIVKSYFTIAHASEDGKPHPLYYRDAYFRGPWAVNINKNVYGGSGKPWTSTAGVRMMTLFMLQLPSARFVDEDGHPCLDATHSQDLFEYWFDCDDQFVFPGLAPVPFPNAVGEFLTLVEDKLGVEIWATDIALNSQRTELVITFGKETYGTGGPYSYTAEVIIDYDGGHTASRTFPGTSTGPIAPITVSSLTDFEAISFVPGRTLEVTVHVTGTWSSRENVRTTQFTIQ